MYFWLTSVLTRSFGFDIGLWQGTPSYKERYWKICNVLLQAFKQMTA